MSTIWTPLFSFTLFALLFGLGNVISNKTKGLISSVIVLCVLYLLGFWTNIIPADSVATTQFPSLMSAFGLALLITNLGTMIDLADFLKEWKTVLASLAALVGLGVFSFTISSALFGREYALAAASPISGGIVAGIITNDYAIAAGRPEIGGFAMLLVGFQIFVGLPLTSFLLKREANRLVKQDMGSQSLGETTGKKKINIRIFPEMPKSMQNDAVYLAKLGIVGIIAYAVSQLTIIPGSNPTNYYLNPNIAYLLFGLLFTELGFLEKQSLAKAGCMGFLMMGMIAIVPSSLNTITLEVFIDMIVPILGTLIVGAIALMLFGLIAGKLLGFSKELSMAIGLTAMVGYPGTQIATEEIVRNLDCGEEEREKIMNYLLPKMLIGGFTTVTIASVVFAGIVSPMIFV